MDQTIKLQSMQDIACTKVMRLKAIEQFYFITPFPLSTKQLTHKFLKVYPLSI